MLVPESPDAASGSTKVTFSIDFRVGSPLHAHAVSAFFGNISQQQLNAFVLRCQQLYGTQKPFPTHKASTSKRAEQSSTAEVAERLKEVGWCAAVALQETTRRSELAVELLVFNCSRHAVGRQV